MPAWLDLLRTPMAAPETSALRRMRRTWQALCALTAGLVPFAEPLRCEVGRAAPCFIAALIAATIIWTVVYLVCKHRADTAFLDDFEASK